MKNHKFPTKIIAIFLSLIITAVALPTQAVALFLDNSETSTESLVIENDSEIEQPGVFIVEEDTSKRGQFEKHYLCSDGTYVSVTYPEAVHYMDSNQVWRDVDQSLTYDSKTESYISEKADFKVSFSDNFSSTNLASIERNGYSLSWGIQTAKKATVNEVETSSVQTNIIKIESTDLVIAPSTEISAQVTNKQEVEFNNLSDRLVSNEDSFALPNISSQISYNDIIDGSENVSVRYTVYHNKVEEDIIIAKRGDISSVSMNMDIGTLTPVVNDDGSVDLVDANNNMQFRVGIPYMMDADFNVCNDITVTAEKIGSNCIITYTPNPEWFNSADRVFPIILDPSITTNDYVCNIEDTYVEKNSTANHTSEQYLQINPNGTYHSKAIVRVLELPIIDESMPIISANLKLTTQTTPFSNVSLKASLCCTGLEMDEFTYNVTNIISYDYVTYGTLNHGGYSAVFDCSAHIYEMYGYQQLYDIPCVDFVIEYANDTDTAVLYPFYSSEYTVPANRPVFTVRYGYTLPAGILDGGVYLFQNYASFAYMSVSSVNPVNNSNVYQLHNYDNELLKRQQKFKLEYVSGTGGYLLRFLGTSSGTDKLVSINRNNGNITGGQNVYLSSTADAMSQEWLIIPVDYEKFKIVPRANMDCALTAYYYSDGSNTGTTALSIGNIFIQTYSKYDNYQHWYIYDESDNQLNTSEFRSTIDSGNYIISNGYTGRYLHRTGKVANCMSGTMYDLGENTITLKIVNLGDGYCTIQPTDLAHYYLAPTSSSSGSGVRFVSSTSETIPDNCKWHIEVASGGGCIIQSKSTGYYLSAVSSTANPSSVCMYALNSAGTVAYQKQVWRIGPADEYIPLGYGASFNDLAIDVGETKAPSVNKDPSNATWANYTDFDYTITSGSEYVSYDPSTHKFTGEKRAADSSTDPAVATVTAVHKTTGLSHTFNVKVNRNAIIVIPGILGSELYMGDNNPYFKSGTDIISQDMLNKIAEIEENTTTAQVIALVGAYLINPAAQLAVSPAAKAFANMFYDSIKCNNDGSSKYEVYTKKYAYVGPTYDEDGDYIITSSTGYDSQYYTTHAGVQDAYYELIKSLRLDSAIMARYSVELFFYDWRLSNAVSAERLDEFIEGCGYDKVIFVAHSMGGLVASGYLALGEEHRNKVDGVYMLSSPLLGCPEVINVWGNLDLSFITNNENIDTIIRVTNSLLSYATLVDDPIRMLISNYQSVYELLPNSKYLDVAEYPYLVETVSIALTTFETTTVCDNYESSKELISQMLPYYDSALMGYAESFHNSCYYNSQHISSCVDTKYIYTIPLSSQELTLVQLEYKISRRTSSTTIIDYTSIQKNIEGHIGDTLVPYWSAIAGLSKGDPKVKFFYGYHMEATEKKTTGSDKNEIVEYVKNDILSN